jgi:signal transduction histidine kinase
LFLEPSYSLTHSLITGIGFYSSSSISFVLCFLLFFFFPLCFCLWVFFPSSLVSCLLLLLLLCLFLPLLLLGFFFLLFFLRVWGDSRFFWVEFLCFWNHQYASLFFVGEEKQWVLGAKGGCILVACRSCIFEELLKKRKWIGFREEERSLTKTSSYQVSERERERERES